MTEQYHVIALSNDERDRLMRTYDDLMGLTTCAVPSVRAAARAALAHVAQALNGQGLAYDLYTKRLED